MNSNFARYKLLMIIVSTIGVIATQAQAVEYKPPYEAFVKSCDSKGNNNTVIDTDTEVECFTELEEEYDKDFQKRSQEQIEEYDKSIAEKTAKIMELQFQIKDNRAKIAKLRVANKNNTGTYEENLAEIARLEKNIANMDRLIKGMQEFAK